VYDEIMTLDQIKTKLRKLERDLIRGALEEGGWNQHRTARALKCWPTTLRRIIESHPELKKSMGKYGSGQGRPPGNGS
jgi:DNA-binding NtrC family response regulator